MRRYRAREKTLVGKVIEATATRAGTTIAVAADVLRAFAVELPGAVWGQGRVQWPELATFSVRARKPRRAFGGAELPADRRVYALVAKSWRRSG